jgi:hypothetical protein
MIGRTMQSLGRPLRCSLLVVCLLLIASGADAVRAQAPLPPGRAARTWSARSSTGQTFAGSWTGTVDGETGAATGTWTLITSPGVIAASGGWSAAKAPSGWNGSWRAVVSGRQGEYAGTWAARVDLAAGAGLGDLFAKAAEAAVSGTWQAGRQSGAWAIRVFK